MKKRQFYTIATTILASMVFIACGGGGGGGGGGNPPAQPAPNATFTALDLVELSAGSQFSAAVAVNSSGQIVGASDDGTGSIKAVTWTADQTARSASPPTMLSPIAGNNFSAAHGINDSGMVTGRSQSGADTVPVIWAPAATDPTALLTFAAGTSGAAYSANGTGQIVGEAQIAVGGASHATLWNSTGEAAQDLGTLAGGTSSAAYHISDTGVIVGESDDATGVSMATMWAGGLPTALAPLDPVNGDAASIAMGVNGAGEIVGEVELVNGEIHAVRWDPTGATITDMGTSGFDSSAQAINTAGNIAGWNSDGGGPLVARYDASTPGFERLLNDVTTFSQSYGLNDNGTTVGVSALGALVIIPN